MDFDFGGLDFEFPDRTSGGGFTQTTDDEPVIEVTDRLADMRPDLDTLLGSLYID